MIIVLPIPPSTNQLFINLPRGGRAKSPHYTKWIAQADQSYWVQKSNVKAVSGPYSVSIRVPRKTRADIDNLNKPILDWIVSREIAPDDKHCQRISIERADVLECEIEIKAATEA